MAFALVSPAVATEAPLPPLDRARELALLMRKLDRTARILYVTAHPDDEDAGLLVRLVHGEGVEVALLTATRGEGGQNEIGTELFSALGVLRSRELEAAARYTGVKQYFTRAFEFGYSFSVEETYEKWGHDAVLHDIVRVVREFRPDVILTLPHVGEGGGQHHQATARLAAEAFGAAARDDWPELGPPHQAARLYRAVWREDEAIDAHCFLELGTYDAVLGASYEELGVESRSAHKCQGMARYTDPLPSRLSRWECRFVREGEPRSTSHFLDGVPEPLIETSRGVTDFGVALRRGADAARAAHRKGADDELVAELLSLHRLVGEARDGRSNDPTARVRLETLERRIARALLLASGVRLRARAATRYVAPGDTLVVVVEAQNTGYKPALIDIGFAGSGADASRAHRVDARSESGGRGRMPPQDDPNRLALTPGAHARASYALVVGGEAEPTIARPVPENGTDVDDARAARFLRPAWRAFELAPALTLAGRVVPLPPIPVSCQELDASFPSIFYSDPHVVPDPSVRFARDVIPVPMQSQEGFASVELLVSSLDGGPVTVRLETPDGWRVTPEVIALETPAGGVEIPARFALTASERVSRTGEASIRASARHAGVESRQGYRPVVYRHIRPGALLEEAAARLVPFECAVAPEVHVGYVEGAGDRVLEALDALGVPVDVLDSGTLLEGDLDAYDVILTGVRAYKVRDDLAGAHGRLMDWVAGGGTLLVQYNKLEFNAGAGESPFAPFPGTRIGHRRVTVEESPVIINAPEHPVFTYPNPIGDRDWAGWVQERGLYFLDFEDPRYVDLVTLEDPWPYNSGTKGGALVLATLGEGEWVYVGLGLFRQLPAGVPGAYRLLANLLALGAR